MNDLLLSSPLPLDQNAAAVYIASLPAPTGRRTQAQALRVVASILKADIASLNWGALRYQHTALVRSQLIGSYKPATANKILSALRQTLKHAWLLGQMTAEEYGRAVELEPVTGETLPTGRELSTGEIRALLTACKADANHTAGTRDAAILCVMYVAGLRREEVAGLQLSDYSDGTLTLTGKRNKERLAYIVNGALEALNDWIAVRGSEDGALFVHVNKSGKIANMSSLTPQAIYNMLSKRAREANVRSFSPHDMRRTFISHLLEANADIATVSKMAGHANVQTTARYDRRPEEAKRKAASLLHVPY